MDADNSITALNYVIPDDNDDIDSQEILGVNAGFALSVRNDPV